MSREFFHRIPSTMLASPPLDPPRPFSMAVAAHGLLLLGAMVAIGLAGFATQGNLGVFLLFAGAALIVCPPAARVRSRWWWGGGVLVGCCSGALLPARWPVSGAAWRHTLGELSVIPLPSTISPAPQETLFWLALLALTVVIGLFVLAQPIRSGALVYLVLVAVLFCGGYAALSIGASFAQWRPPLVHEPSFGFFPNRNHTASFLVTGSILALSLLNVGVLARRWIIVDLAMAALLPCVVALFCFSGSRGGVVFLIVGVVLWGAGFWAKHRDRRLLAVQAGIAVVVLGCLLASRSLVRDRLLSSLGLMKSPPGASATPTPSLAPLIPDKTPPEQGSDLRIPIWRDTLHMIADAPWTGTGLGTFALVFPQYRQGSRNGSRALHPESDWLLFIAETGLPAFLWLGVLGVGLGRRLAAGRPHLFWPLRWGCAAAALTSLLHGAVDVPAHRAALGWWILVLAGLSLSLVSVDAGRVADHRPPRRPGRWHWQRIVFLLTGLAALTLGGLLVAAEWFGGPDLPPFLVAQAPFEIFRLQEQKHFTAAETLARRVIRLSPLFDQPYFYLAVTLAAASDDESTDAQVDDLFRAQRRLDPDTPSIPLLQAGTWAGYDPVRLTAMYLDAVARTRRIDQSEGASPQQAVDYYGAHVNELRAQPDAQRYLLGAMRPDVRFEHAWRENVAPELARAQAGNIADDEALLQGLSETDRHRLQPDWYLQPARDPAPSLLPDGRGAARLGWPVRLRQLVNAGQYQPAVGELSLRYGISLALPNTAAELQIPTVPDRTLAAIQQSWLKGDFGEARRLLKAVPVDTNDPASLELLRGQAALAAHDSDWSEAWLDLETYVQRTRQTEWP